MVPQVRGWWRVRCLKATRNRGSGRWQRKTTNDTLASSSYPRSVFKASVPPFPHVCTTTYQPTSLHHVPKASCRIKSKHKSLTRLLGTHVGQLRLKKASVLIVGAGGLGCPAAMYLAGAGVGTIGLVDGDVVEASNLHRQIAHSTERVGMFKVDSAIASLQR